jgi:hypothetical protein
MRMKIALLMLIFVATAGPALAGELQISCETVQARAAGMTAQQERRARQCFVTKEIATK